MGRSKRAPSLRTCAGARFTVILRTGNSKPQFRSAASTRSRLSRTAASGSPTIEKVGSPAPRSASTSTNRPWIPCVVQLRTRASMGPFRGRAGRSVWVGQEQLSKLLVGGYGEIRTRGIGDGHVEGGRDRGEVDGLDSDCLGSPHVVVERIADHRDLAGLQIPAL